MVGGAALSSALGPKTGLDLKARYGPDFINEIKGRSTMSIRSTEKACPQARAREGGADRGFYPFGPALSGAGNKWVNWTGKFK